MTNLAIPNPDFVSGTSISSAQVDANFGAIQTFLNTTGVPKVQDGAVDTAARIVDGIITPAKLSTALAAQVAASAYSDGIERTRAITGTVLTSNVDPRVATTESQLINQSQMMSLVYLPVDATVTGVAWYQTIKGVYTANNENRVGLYSFNTSTGALALVASSANDANLWQGSTNGGVMEQRKAFSSPYVATAGPYFIGALYCSSAVTTPPKIAALPQPIASAANIGSFGMNYPSNNKFLDATISTQTALLASATLGTGPVAWSGSPGGAGAPLFGLY